LSGLRLLTNPLPLDGGGMGITSDLTACGPSRVASSSIRARESESLRLDFVSMLRPRDRPAFFVPNYRERWIDFVEVGKLGLCKPTARLACLVMRDVAGIMKWAHDTEGRHRHRVYWKKERQS